MPKGYYIILLSIPFCSKPIRKNGIKHKTIETEPVVTLFDNVLKGGGGEGGVRLKFGGNDVDLGRKHMRVE